MDRRAALKKTAMAAGSAALVPSLFSLLQACQKKPRLNWEPIFLTLNQAELISTLVDTLLPRTETPGALDMKVDLFIDVVFAKLFDKSAQQAMIAQMERLNTTCEDKFGSIVSELSVQDREEFLKEQESTSGKYNGKVWGTAVGEQKPVGFYRTLKSLALWGYFSSEEIGKNVLNYDPIPGEYLGCIPLSDIGNTWSL
ncbi:MAG: gluconate 2-dehydrogenase subunit 3 family protein [Eudoraea sp.]|uniref:gluconate 2-dehydrogenase subunit 3 family protein n=1 Tax=Eudoraea sp. TaxID=1979955 RepID=UPI003C76AAB4